ncbi:MAG: homoserine O-acetyltransferase [Flavobacteriales bacterium]|nr:homoserine O-acetyltransferase [Flavobacteriales bacterium]
MLLEKFKYKKKFTLESGEQLQGLELAYHTYGTLNKEKSNVIWVCHALTGNSDVVSWWQGLVGEDKLFNPDEHFIICVNILGSCYGTTGPLSINPQTREPYFHDFPEITIRDISKTFSLIKEHLGIKQIHTLIGGSLGGQQALEWIIQEPNCAKNVVLMATNASHSPWGIAFNESQRMAILMDQTWSENNELAGINGMKVARSIALLSYRNYNTYKFSQSETDSNKLDNYKASSYQRYQGEKLSVRFNAYSYWILTKALDSHHVGRNRGKIEDVLNSIQCEKCITIGISSDLLFPPEETKFIAEHIPNAQFFEIDSLYGHDGFLLEFDKIGTVLKENLVD